jgi:hypothetical protein
MLMISDVRIFEDVLAIPSKNSFDSNSFILDKDFNIINECGSFYNSFSGRVNFFFDKKQLTEPNSIIDCGVFGGWIWPYFSHFMMDTLSRMWYQKFIQNEKTYFFSVDSSHGWKENYPHLKYINDFSFVFGFNPDKFETINKPTLFKKLIIPNQALLNNLEPTDIWKDFIKTCKWFPLNNKKYSKIYIPRFDMRDNYESFLFGEYSFTEFLEKEGFYVLDVKKHSVSDQWFIISNADVIVIPEGSAILWSLFCDNNKMVIISRRPNRLCYGVSDITDFDFANISSNFMNTVIIDQVVGVVDSLDNNWANISVFLNWNKISIELKKLGLVNNIYKCDFSIRKDVEEYNKVYPFSPDTRYRVEKYLRIMGCRDICV